MPENRKKLIDSFIGNITNVVVHKIAEKATENKEIALHYQKEVENSLNISRKYRDKINPVKATLTEKDIKYIKNKIINKVNSKLKKRISEGYQNINLNLVEEIVEKQLRELNII